MPQNNEIGSRTDLAEPINAGQAKGGLDPIRKPNQEIDMLHQNLKNRQDKLEHLTKNWIKLKNTL